MSMLFTETVTLNLPGEATGGYDDLGNPVVGEPRSEDWPAWYEIGTSSESTDAREQQVWGYTLFLPLDAPLDAASSVTIAGVDYEVIGEPGRQPGGFIVDGYIRAAVQKVSG